MFKKEYLDEVFQFVMFIYVIINDSLDTEINKAKSGLAHESFKKTRPCKCCSCKKNCVSPWNYNTNRNNM